jgi:hypothetical protein
MPAVVKHTLSDLEKIKLVESTIKASKTYQSKKELYNSVKVKVRRDEFDLIIEELESNNKVLVDRAGKVVWIDIDNPKLKKLAAESVPLD